MDQLTVVIPSRNRISKLEKTLNSIPKLDNLEVWVISDDDKETFDFVKNKYKLANVFLSPSHVGSVACRNFIFSTRTQGDVIYATDDIIFEPGSIEHARETLYSKFSDQDGVIGFKQDRHFHPAGVAIVGKTFIERYPARQLFYPMFWHFACQEVLHYCNKIGDCFFLDKDARIQHLHASLVKNLMDNTHHEARFFKKEDFALSLKRKRAGKVWPIN